MVSFAKLGAALCVTPFLALNDVAVAAQPPDYGDVAPIFEKHCIVCHRGEAAPLGLRLDTLAHIKSGSKNGPVAVAGEPSKSEMVRRIRGESQPRMPLTGPPYLNEEETALVVAWIAGGMMMDAAQQAGEQEAPPTRVRPGPGEAVTYADVAPILTQRCVKCHTDQGLRGPPPEGLRLKSRDLILAGGDRVVVVPGSPAASELIRRIKGQAFPRMPFDGPPYLSDEEIRLITDWVAQGAPDEQGNRAPIPAGGRVRLHGVLTGQWALDGLPLAIGRDARIRKGPRVGDYVEVRGVAQADGSIRATRIRPR